ncbi:unnamed protein product, partial [Brassica oleracea]
QSGRKLLELLKERQQPLHVGLPPIEKNLWKAIWKIRAPLKLKHFLWRVLAGAVPVKERLNSRGLHLDSRCRLCQASSESICHLLFSCPFAKEVWDRSGVQLPLNGFSRSSVFLNVYHLIFANGRRSHYTQNRVFPWVLWQIWKTRNALIFKKVQASFCTAAAKALEEADEWFDVNFKVPQAQPVQVETINSSVSWSPPPASLLKCNVGVSWNSAERICGAAWIIRNHDGKALLHSRRAFTGVNSKLEADLQGFCWVMESLMSTHHTNIIVESDCGMAREAILNPTRFPWFGYLLEKVIHALPFLYPCSLEHVEGARNKVAEEIAVSVTRDHRCQSYVASGGPRWLLDILESEARRACT